MSTLNHVSQSSSARKMSPGWTLIAVALGFVMATLDVTIVNVALAELQRSLSFRVSGLAWVIDGYTLTFASLLLAGGTLGTRLGAKQAYQAGLIIFLGASLLCGISTSDTMLIGARMLQGFGAAVFMPSSMALLVMAYPDQTDRAKAIALWAAIVSIASGLGPLIGGVLTELWGWRSLFLINLPIGIVGVALTAWVVLPTEPKLQAFNLRSHLLGILMIGGLCFSLIEGPEIGWMSAPVITSVAVSLAAFLLLILHEHHSDNPVIPARIFQGNGMIPLNCVGFLLNFATFGIIFLLSLYFQQGQSLSPIEAGTQLLPMMAVFAVANLVAGKLAGHFGQITLLRAGTFLAAAAILPLIVRPDLALHSPWILTLCISVTNLGVGLSVPMMTALIMHRAGPEHASMASAILNANRQLGALFGVAAMAVIIQIHTDWANGLYTGLGLLIGAHGLSFIITRVLTQID
ncbi:MFS transporter [Photobacterium sp. 1_MG-2023]|uniref:MFS transporter n=1 Tax=Photobacterium sp. 1_MG-2023 TaxID=3062646 RepID=UPI0026E28274|nr:MFS transporter [Photobacterium sp. 1_MG-2023]MDO6707319.1 MFS transporter [Photobacterium sp. 1_MG-2023]